MSFVESLPVELRLHGWSGHKYLYRKAIAKWLQDEILCRSKIGFTTPMDDWFQREIAGQRHCAICEMKTQEPLHKTGIVIFCAVGTGPVPMPEKIVQYRAFYSQSGSRQVT